LHLAEARGVLISEGLGYRQGLHRGDTLTLNSPRGPLEFPVLGVVEDHTWPLGSILMDETTYQDSFADPLVHEFAVTLDGSRPAAEVRRALEDEMGGAAVVLSNAEMRAVVFEVFHQFWSLLVAQELLAVLVAFLATFHALVLSVLLRRREIGLLRAVGAPKGVVRRMIHVEGALLGFGGGLLALGFGLLVGAACLGPVTLEEQGYRAPLTASWVVAGATVLAAALAGWIAGLLPGRAATEIDVLRVVSQE
jgi:putative ABC transport system permease protein